jgi:hypothetical protein
MIPDNVRYDESMALVASPLKRLSRPETPPSFRLTDRDRDILLFVALARCATSEQVARRVGGSPRGVGCRLKLLFRAGYLDRPVHQHTYLASFFDEGNRPLVYALGRKGARLLAEDGAPVDDRLDWTTKNKRATAPFLAHTVEVAEAMLGFRFPAHESDGPELIDHAELIPLMPEETRAKRDPFKLSVEIKHNHKPITIAVVPDRLFSFAFVDGTRMNFALELDRGTMDIKAKRLVGKSSFRKKIIGYFNAWAQKRHTETWGFKSFRVLTVTPSEKRLANMLKAQQDVTKGSASGLFLYTTREQLAVHGPYAPVWTTSKADGISLLPPLSTLTETTDA